MLPASKFTPDTNSEQSATCRFPAWEINPDDPRILSVETLELTHTLGFSALRFGYPKPSIGAYPCCLGRFALNYGVSNGFTSGNPCSGLIDLFTKLGTDALYAYFVFHTLYRELCPVNHVPSTLQRI